MAKLYFQRVKVFTWNNFADFLALIFRRYVLRKMKIRIKPVFKKDGKIFKLQKINYTDIGKEYLQDDMQNLQGLYIIKDIDS